MHIMMRRNWKIDDEMKQVLLLENEIQVQVVVVELHIAIERLVNKHQLSVEVEIVGVRNRI